MELDVLGLIGACSYALDCVEAELVHVTSKHAKRVAYMSVCMHRPWKFQDKRFTGFSDMCIAARQRIDPVYPGRTTAGRQTSGRTGQRTYR